ncbi:MAG: hypothetical protein AAF074_25750, partial [Pseudomonadota bacterium]
MLEKRVGSAGFEERAELVALQDEEGGAADHHIDDEMAALGEVANAPVHRQGLAVGAGDGGAAERAEFRALLPGFLADLYRKQFGKGLQAKPEIREVRPARRDFLVR